MVDHAITRRSEEWCAFAVDTRIGTYCLLFKKAIGDGTATLHSLLDGLPCQISLDVKLFSRFDSSVSYVIFILHFLRTLENLNLCSP